ncbi:hypothetical protein VNO77_19789 [Canavalia gladiata]|uniref:Uncharacterized protein n=1 Tax=Canavalia gladiata TaxID=3824 RepID=A0AAN9QLS6_CANGL
MALELISPTATTATFLLIPLLWKYYLNQGRERERRINSVGVDETYEELGFESLGVDGVDEGNGLDSIDFDALIKNLEDLTKVNDILIPEFDYQQKRFVSYKTIKSASSSVVIVDDTYAFHAKLRSLLDVRVVVGGGVHFSLLSKVRYNIGDSCSLDYLIGGMIPLFRKYIEPDLRHAQIRINSSFVLSFREAIYKVKCRSESSDEHSGSGFQGNNTQTDNFIEMYLRPPAVSEEARINDRRGS